jgi:hypothetical protein
MQTVNLAWNANTELDLAGYDIFRALGTAPSALLASVGKVVAFTDTQVPDTSQTVTYTLKAFDLKGNRSGLSNPAAVVVDVSPPQAPTGLTAVLA